VPHFFTSPTSSWQQWPRIRFDVSNWIKVRLEKCLLVIISVRSATKLSIFVAYTDAHILLRKYVDG